MEYEWTIICLSCGYVKSQGGLTGPPNLTDAEVSQHAEHNPGCCYGLPCAYSVISSTVDANVTSYSIRGTPVIQ